jgi:DegV family protein with EDD domain
MAAAKARDAGANLRECVEEARHSLESSRFLFTPESLRFLEKGGRIGKAAALLGNLMNVSPIITVKDGFASTYAKVRTQKRALAKIVDVFKQDVEENGLKNVAVHYIGSRKAAEEWAGSIESSVGRDVLIVPASPVIGLHVGPALGLAYECENPLPNKFAGARPEIVTV